MKKHNFFHISAIIGKWICLKVPFLGAGPNYCGSPKKIVHVCFKHCVQKVDGLTSLAACNTPFLQNINLSPFQLTNVIPGWTYSVIVSTLPLYRSSILWWSAVLAYARPDVNAITYSIVKQASIEYWYENSNILIILTLRPTWWSISPFHHVWVNTVQQLIFHFILFASSALKKEWSKDDTHHIHRHCNYLA